jgi:hypothetical protein
MRRAIVKGHRTDRHAGPMVLLVCPHCGQQHWMPAAETGWCPRRTSNPPFIIASR